MESEKRFSLQKSEICCKVFTDKSNEWDKGRILTSYLARRAKHLSLLRSPALLALAYWSLQCSAMWVRPIVIIVAQWWCYCCCCRRRRRHHRCLFEHWTRIEKSNSKMKLDWILKTLLHTGKSVSEALILELVNVRLFIELQEKYKFRTCCVQKLFFCFCFDIQNNICTQHVLNLYFSCNSMNNLSSYCGLTDSRMRGSDTDLPVNVLLTLAFSWSFRKTEIYVFIWIADNLSLQNANG